MLSSISSSITSRGVNLEFAYYYYYDVYMMHTQETKSHTYMHLCIVYHHTATINNRSINWYSLGDGAYRYAIPVLIQNSWWKVCNNAFFSRCWRVLNNTFSYNLGDIDIKRWWRVHNSMFLYKQGDIDIYRWWRVLHNNTLLYIEPNIGIYIYWQKFIIYKDQKVLSVKSCVYILLPYGCQD